MIKLTNEQYRALEIIQSMDKEQLNKFLTLNDHVNQMEKSIIETLGTETALKEILKVLNIEKKEEIFSYICRNYEIEV